MSDRPASHAGQWYSADGNLLDSELDEWLNMSKNTVSFDSLSIKAIIVPHAGYKYSGIFAASSYAILKETKPKLVVILGPSHFKLLRNQCALSQFSGVQTPLGNIKIDAEAVEKLNNSDPNIFTISKTEEDTKEHSLEMQFPFLFKIFGGDKIKILPILVGNFTDDLKRRAAAKILSANIGYLKQKSDILFVISSDFCHYGPRFDYIPTFENSELSLNENISVMDKMAFDTLNSNDPIKCFKDILNRTGNTICGRDPILLFLELLHQSNIVGEWNLIDYGQSNFLTAINDHSVSYLTAAQGAEMTTEFNEIFSSLNELLQTLADSKEGQELKIPLKLNTLVENMRKVDISAAKEYSDTFIPIDVIEILDKSSSIYPIEDMLKDDFQETERVNLELRDIKNRFNELSESLAK